MKIWPVAKILKVAKNFLKNPITYSSSSIALLISLIQDKRLGIETCGYSFSGLNINLDGDAREYSPTTYSKLKKMIIYLKLNREDVFIDLGCGAGRPVFLAGTQRLKKIVGIEINKELADIAKRNLKNLKLNNTPIEIINTDASAFDVKEGTIFFMFDPFGEKTFTKVIENIKNSLVTNPRKIRIAYYYPVYRNLLDLQDWLVSEGEIDKTDIFVWRSLP